MEEFSSECKKKPDLREGRHEWFAHAASLSGPGTLSLEFLTGTYFQRPSGYSPAAVIAAILA